LGFPFPYPALFVVKLADKFEYNGGLIAIPLLLLCAWFWFVCWILLIFGLLDWAFWLNVE